jgi:hypothetical protein
METDRLRTLVATLISAGDFGELLHLYGAEDVSLSPDALLRVYAPDEMGPDDREVVEETRRALADELLPPLDRPASVPAEMVELTARCAAERGKVASAVKALREVDALERFYRRYLEFALESLRGGEYERAAFELVLAGRLGWARRSPEERMAFVVGLGVDANELASALGAHRERGKLAGGRELPDFAAPQTYGPLFHAACGITGCVSARPLEERTALAIRWLIHDDEVAQAALEAVGAEAPTLLRYLARETDDDLAAYAEAYDRAAERLRQLEPEHESASPDEEPPAGGATDSEPEPSDDGEEPEATEPTEQPSRPKDDTLRAGLEEIQQLLLGRPEPLWRNCLAELSERHPLSLLTVCTVRVGRVGSYVVPVGENGKAFLNEVTGGR